MWGTSGDGSEVEEEIGIAGEGQFLFFKDGMSVIRASVRTSKIN